jgi:hypothetical protein
MVGPGARPTVDWQAWANALPFRGDIGLVGIELDAGSAEFRMERPASYQIPTAR